MIQLVNVSHNKAGVAILMSLDFTVKNNMRNNEGCYAMRKGSIYERNTKILKIICLATTPSKIHETKTSYKEKLTNLQGDFSTSFSVMDRLRGQNYERVEK